MAAKPRGKVKLKNPLKGTPRYIRPFPSRVLYLVMASVAVVILVGGYLFYYFQAQQMRQHIEGGLSIVAQLKADQIAEWRAERLNDADMLVGSPFFTEGVEKYFASPTDTEVKDKILAKLAVIEKAYPYQDILLTDVNGKVLLSLNDSVHRVSDMTLAQLAVAIKEHKAVFTDFHYLPDSNSPHLNVIAPLFPWGQDSPQAIGAVVLCINPSQYFYPLLQSSPMPSETAETLLVERDGEQVLFLNERRHQKDTALKLRIPLSEQDVPAVMAVLGKEGFVEGKDYRGAKVLAALKHIPDSPWYMVAKIDTSEALAVWRSRSGLIIAFFAGLLVAALAVVGLIWQRRRRLAYQALYQAELETQALRSHFEYLVKYANDIIILVDENYHIVEVNDRALEAYGYTRQEMLGLPLTALVAPEDISSYRARLRKIQQKGAIVAEAIHQRKDGSTFPVEVSGRAIKIEDKTYLQEIVRDITERKRAEETLRQSEEKYRDLFVQSMDPVFISSREGIVIDANQAMLNLFGYTRKELIGMDVRKVYLNPKDRPKFQQKIEQKGFINDWEIKVRKKDGTEVECLLTSVVRWDDDKNILGYQGIIRDISERKMAEEEKIQLELKAQITSRLASVGEMAAGVAHEINNPLTAVTGYAQLLVGREDIPPEIRSDLEAINDGARRVAGIVRTLLAFSRQTKPQRKLADINELIESTLILRAYHLRVNNIEVVTRLAPDLPETVADPGQIQQVLLNLIVNAEMEMKLAHGKGKLTITTKKSDSTIKICVKDNGPGIMPEVMDRMFDPFFTTRETGQGTGLGLSLCYGIVTEHKGKIYAESKPGKGATFIVELPVVTEDKPPKPAEPDVKKSQKAGKARILVVDDEQVVRDVVNRVLTGEGYKVETADNAADALKKIESKRYKLILVDIKMPGMNGVELYKRIQKIDKSLAQRVVFITGDIMGADTEKFLFETKVAHIEKPFDAEQLSREVRRVLIGGR